MGTTLIGLPLHTYLYGADLAVWLLSLLSRGRTGVAYNLGSDQAVTIRELAFMVRDVLNPVGEVSLLDRSTGHSTRNVYVLEIGRGRQQLGLEAWTSLVDAIVATAAYQHSLFEKTP